MLATFPAEQQHVDPVEEFDHFQGFGAPPEAVHDDVPSQVLDEVRNGLNRVGRVTFRKISVSFEEGRVVLRGSVRTWFEKQLAQHIAMETPGVPRLVNHLVVDPGRSREA